MLLFLCSRNFRYDLYLFIVQGPWVHFLMELSIQWSGFHMKDYGLVYRLTLLGAWYTSGKKVVYVINLQSLPLIKPWTVLSESFRCTIFFYKVECSLFSKTWLYWLLSVRISGPISTLKFSIIGEWGLVSRTIIWWLSYREVNGLLACWNFVSELEGCWYCSSRKLVIECRLFAKAV